jgi:hypothetical protein
MSRQSRARASGHAGFYFIFGDEAQFFAVDGVQSFRAPAHRNIKSVRGFGDFPQGGFVQFGGDWRSGGITQEIAAAIIELDRDGDAVRTAHADRIDGHAFFRVFLGGVDGIALEVLSIGDEDENAVVVALLVEEAGGFVDGAGDVGALLGNEVGIEGIQRFAEGFIVAG